MHAGATLKAHRTLDGEKTHILHPLHGPAEAVERAAVETLKRRGLIASNLKFPAATYVLTERGIAAATNSLDEAIEHPDLASDRAALERVRAKRAGREAGEGLDHEVAK